MPVVHVLKGSELLQCWYCWSLVALTVSLKPFLCPHLTVMTQKKDWKLKLLLNRCQNFIARACSPLHFTSLRNECRPGSKQTRSCTHHSHLIKRLLSFSGSKNMCRLSAVQRGNGCEMCERDCFGGTYSIAS